METPNKSPDYLGQGQRMDEPSPGTGGPRRPGNLWTAEARDDMFNRREAGETWETICVDYPNRSRHAMQQQYSMMKKQRALANGTWRVNKRGRKRKVSVGEKKPPVVRKRQPWGYDDDEVEDDETEEDEFVEGYAEESEEMEETEANGQAATSENPATKPRPPLPTRSNTDPMSRPPPPPLHLSPHMNSHPASAPTSNPTPHQSPNLTNSQNQRSKGVSFPVQPHPAGYSHPPSDFPRPGPNMSWNDREANGSVPPNKRRRIEPGERVEMMVTAPPQQQPQPPPPQPQQQQQPPPPPPPQQAPPASYFNLPSIMISEERLRAIIAEGREVAHAVAMNFEAEKTSQRQTFEASLSRANRRAHDEHEKLRNANLDHAEALKRRDREHAEEKQELTRSFYAEQMQRNESHSQEVEALKRTIENQLKEREELEKFNTTLAEEVDAAKKIIAQHIQRTEADGETKADAEEAEEEDEEDAEERAKRKSESAKPVDLTILKEYSQAAALQKISLEEAEEVKKELDEARERLAATKEQLAKAEVKASTTESKLTSAERQLELFDQLRLAISLSVKELRPPQDAAEDAVRSFVAVFRSLSQRFVGFNAGLDDMTMKSIVKASTVIQQDLDEAGRRLDRVCMATQKASRSAHNFVEEYGSSEEAHEHAVRNGTGNGNGSGNGTGNGGHSPYHKMRMTGSPYLSPNNVPVANGYA